MTHRVARATCHIRFSNNLPLQLIRQNALKKGDVLAVSRIAAVQAVKKTSDFIPLAHGGVPVEGCTVLVEPVGPHEPNPPNKTGTLEEQMLRPLGQYGGVRISVQVETTAKTGVEMEALTGVMGAALTVIDMCKAVDQACVIKNVKVAGKVGGRSGGWGIGMLKGLGGSLKETENDLGERPSQSVEEGLEKVKSEDVSDHSDNKTTRKATGVKEWTPKKAVRMIKTEDTYRLQREPVERRWTPEDGLKATPEKPYRMVFQHRYTKNTDNEGPRKATGVKESTPEKAFRRTKSEAMFGKAFIKAEDVYRLHRGSPFKRVTAEDETGRA